MGGNNWSVQEILVSRARDNVTVPGLSDKVNWGAVVEGAMDLFAGTMNHFRLQTALNNMESDVKHLMPKGGGVLVLVVYCTADGPRVFNCASAVRGGLDGVQTFLSYQKLFENKDTI